MVGDSMRGKAALLGIAGPLIAYMFIGLSIGLSPSFSWYRNALSDLGHAQKSNVSPIFNFGLLLSGFLITIYSVKSLINYAKYTGISVAFSALMLQAVAAFDEIYGRIHFVVSVLFFVSAGISCIIYFVEKRSLIALMSFLTGLLAWLTYWFGVYNAGIAVPEIISAIAVTSCIIQSALKIIGVL
jgi:hypothetical membrane protein